MLKQNLQNIKSFVKNKYWFISIKPFIEDVAIFKRTEWNCWVIKSDWTILCEWFTDLWDSSEGKIWFIRWEDFWWLNSIDWSIFKNGFQCIQPFKNGYWQFINKSWKHWWMKSDWTILAEWFDYTSSFFDSKESSRFKLNNLWYYIFPNINFPNIEKWISVFSDKEREKFWWITNSAEIISEWYDKCYQFNEHYEWFAKFEKNWRIGYIDTLWRVWDDINITTWEVNLKRNWKWFKKVLLINNKNVKTKFTV